MIGIVKKVAAAALSCAIAVSLTSTAFAADNDLTTFDDYNQTEITANMGLGWNLGNELEAVWEGENWGYDADITTDLFKLVKEQGFSTVRIPIGWLSRIGDEASGYKVDESWLARIKEVVDMAQSQGLYTIINMHSDGYHTIDGAWLFCDATDEEQVAIKAKYAAVWTQIADYFKDYDEHLVFESMNEEFNGDYSASAAAIKTCYENINDYNQIFVDSVRSTGSNNTKRWVLMPGWNTDINYTVDSQYGFQLPDDTLCTADTPRMMVSVHYYDPYNFTINENSKQIKTQWGKYAEDGEADNWGQEDYVDYQFSRLYESYTSQGIPVIIGEFSAMDRTNVAENSAEYRRYYLETVVKTAKTYGCIPVYWDNGWNGKNGMGVVDKTTNTVTQPTMIEGMVRAITLDSSYVIPAPGDKYDPDKTESSSEESSDSVADSTADSSSSTDSSTSSTADSKTSTTSSKAAATNTTTTSNPNTGAAAGGIAVLAVAALTGAVVIKKRK